MKEILETWASNLRSGDYTQATNSFRTENEEYCAVGVLCNMLDPNMWVKDEANGDYLWRDKNSVHPKIEARTGIPETFVDHVIYLNDYKGRSFNHIADCIDNFVSLM